MGPGDTMSNLSLNSSSDSTTLQIPKLRDDGSNWSDYQPRIQKAMGSKGLWRHVEGTAVAPKPYAVVNGEYFLSDLKTPATEEQIESKEMKLADFEKKEYLAQHIILSTTSVRLGSKIKDLMSAKDMWEVVKADATTKSTLYLLDAEDQLSSMKLSENEDPKAHLTELKQHLQTMLQRRDNLIKMGSSLSDTRFNTLIMSSLPDSYRPTLQTITAAERASMLTGARSTKMKHDDLIAFLIEEAQHRVINEERGRNAELALAAHTKKEGRNRPRKRGKSDKNSNESKEKCENCGGSGHTKPNCWSKGGGKEGQGPRQRKAKKTETATVAATNDDNEELFAFTCTSDYADVTEILQVPKSKLGTCVDSGASRDYSPDRSKFTNYRTIDRDITTADGRIVKAIGMGDLTLDLPNGSKTTKTVFKDAIHAPGMAFTLLSISRLDKADHKVIFHKQMCTIKNSKGRTIATIPHSEGLYRVITSNQASNGQHANVVMEKMDINEAHRKFGHISSAAIKHAVSKGFITGINLDESSKPEFCEACAKAKSARQPFPKESHLSREIWRPCALGPLVAGICEKPKWPSLCSRKDRQCDLGNNAIFPRKQGGDF